MSRITVLQGLLTDLDIILTLLSNSENELDFVVTRLDYWISNYAQWNTFSLSVQVLRLLENVQDILLYEQNRTANVKRRGRPKIEIPHTSLEYLLSLNFKVPQVAKMFGVSRETVFRRLKENNISVKKSYTIINDGDLCTLIQNCLLNHPNTGYKRMIGYLRNQNIKVTEQRVREAMRIVDPTGVSHRRTQNRAIVRRQYYVEHFNDMWHIDTNMKLVRWNLIIRGGIDGKSRTCVFLNCSNDNQAQTNLLVFLDGVSKYGIPLRTRTDKGKENTLIARYMIETRGCGRASHICGRSVHNQRIERFWKDVTYGCTSFYRLMFTALEENGLLNVENPNHIHILHKIFIPRINNHLSTFADGWNNHPISTERNYSPKQLMVLNIPPPDHDLQLNEIDLEDAELICNYEQDIEEMNGENEIQFPLLPDCTLTALQLSYLDTLDVMQHSNNYGYDIYETAVTFLAPS